MIRLFWLGNAFLSLLLTLALFLIFSHAEVTPLQNIDVTPKGQTRQDTKRPLDYYSDIWDINVNIKAPAVVAAPQIPSDWHQQLIARNIKIEQIISNGFALVTIGGQSRLLESLNEGNKEDRSRPWEIKVSGHQVIVQDIVFGKGIQFRFEQAKKEVWLEHKDTKTSDSKGSSQAKVLGENQYSITREEGTDLLKNSDKHIEELAPVLEYDENRNPIGVKLRRVNADSKAYNFGLRENDIINDINGSPLTSLTPESVRQLIEKHRKDNGVVVKIIRNNQKITLSFDIRK